MGKADIHVHIEESLFEGITTEAPVILPSGANIFVKECIFRVRRNPVVGVNAVLLESMGEYEIRGGVPAYYIGKKDE